jgi:phosphoribosylaminoimidazole-succinocarboxamide synthase
MLGLCATGVAVGVSSTLVLASQPSETGACCEPKACLETDLKGLKRIYSGKVRDLYEVDEDSVLQVATDRLSSFDVVMTNGIPGKGKILTQLAVWWFETLEKEGGCPNHIITADVDKMPEKVREHADEIRGRCMLVKKLDMLPVEAIVRGYITGSGFVDYQKTGHVCGIPLPAGLVDCQQIPSPIFTPSTKAELGAHDENISFDKTIALLGLERATELSKQSLHYYNVAQKLAAEKGIILADTKFEFGLDKHGALLLADEIVTPDCSRFWDRSKYAAGRQQDSLDKQIVRNYLLSINYDKSTPMVIPDEVVQATLNKYIQIFTVLTGKAPEL